MRYAITNLEAAAPDDAMARFALWREQLERWTGQGVAWVQLREKTLEAGEVFALASFAMRWFAEREEGAKRPRLLVNGRADVALAAGADGVHLTAREGELRPDQVRGFFGERACVVSLSAHTAEEAARASQAGADLILFGPVREKRVEDRVVTPGTGFAALAAACRAAAPCPVLALGGLGPEDTDACLAAGARGVAGIRSFS